MTKSIFEDGQLAHSATAARLGPSGRKQIRLRAATNNLPRGDGRPTGHWVGASSVREQGSAAADVARLVGFGTDRFDSAANQRDPTSRRIPVTRTGDRPHKTSSNALLRTVVTTARPRSRAFPIDSMQDPSPRLGRGMPIALADL